MSRHLLRSALKHDSYPRVPGSFWLLATIARAMPSNASSFPSWMVKSTARCTVCLTMVQLLSRILKEMLPRLDSFEHAAIVPAQIAPAQNDAAKATEPRPASSQDAKSLSPS